MKWSPRPFLEILVSSSQVTFQVTGLRRDLGCDLKLVLPLFTSGLTAYQMDRLRWPRNHLASQGPARCNQNCNELPTGRITALATTAWFR